MINSKQSEDKMKNKFFTLTAAVFILIGGYGCRDYSTKTKINSDGSCERTVILKGDSSEIANPASLPFPIPVNSTWKIERKKDTSEKNSFYYIAIKNFDNVNSLNNEYKNSEKIGVNIKFEKKFRWFYTYYDYEEIYKAFFPFLKIPLKSFLTPKEYEMFLNDDTTKAFKKRLDEYAEKNYYEYFFDALISSAEHHNLKDLSREKVLSNKEYIRENIERSSGDNKTIFNILEKTFGTKPILDLKTDIEKISFEIELKIKAMGDANGSYENEIIMPGIILSTNSKSINGNTVLWKVYEKRFCYEDFTMTVQSRVVNVWAFVVSGAIVLVVIILLLLPKLRKKNQRV